MKSKEETEKQDIQKEIEEEIKTKEEIGSKISEKIIQLSKDENYIELEKVLSAFWTNFWIKEGLKIKLEGFLLGKSQAEAEQKKKFKEMIEECSSIKCGWSDDICDRIDKQELLQKLEVKNERNKI